MFIIKINNDNIIGVYDNIDAALNIVYSITDILENQTVNILKYKINSGIILENYDIDLNYNITVNKKINYNNQEIYTNYNRNNIYKVESNDNLSEYQEHNNYQDDSENNTSVITDELSESTDNTIKKNKIKELFNITQEKNNLNQAKINIIHDLNILKEKQKKQQEDENIYNNDLNLYHKFKNLKEKDATFIIPIMFEEKFKIFEKLKNISYENFKKEYNPEKMKTSYADLFESEENSDDIISCNESVFCDAEVIDLNNALNKNNI
jgi:hypothetical protein